MGITMSPCAKTRRANYAASYLHSAATSSHSCAVHIEVKATEVAPPHTGERADLIWLKPYAYSTFDGGS